MVQVNSGIVLNQIGSVPAKTSWTKRQIINKAFAEIGLASYVFDLTADELQDALCVLDAMMAEWTARGIVFDPVYPNPVDIGGGDIDDETNAPPEANAAMYKNLALQIAPGYGKSPSPQTMKGAKSGYSLLAQAIEVPCIQMNGMIRGAGTKTPIRPFIRPASDEE